MVPGTRERAPLDAVRGRCRSRPMWRTRRPARPGPGPGWWNVTAAAMALVLSVAHPAAAWQGNPPPDERRTSVDRHAARRAALERQRRGDAVAVGVQGAPEWSWPAGVCAPAAWEWSYRAPRAWPYQAPHGWTYRAPRGWWHHTPGAWFGNVLCGWGRGSLWGWAPGGAPWGWTDGASPRGWGYGIGPRRGRPYRPGPEWPGRRVWPGDRVLLRIDVPYDWPWGWPYVPRHRFDGRYTEDRADGPGFLPPGSFLQPGYWGAGAPGYRPRPWAPTPGWPPVAGWHGAEAGPTADCAFVVIEPMHGGTFSGWIAPSRFGTEDLRELEVSIDAILSEGHSLFVVAPDGYAVRVPAGLPIEAIRVVPCSTRQ